MQRNFSSQGMSQNTDDVLFSPLLEAGFLGCVKNGRMSNFAHAAFFILYRFP